MKLVNQIATEQVPAGQLAAWWLGGSGFVLKSPGGTRIYIDPYLTDSANAIFGVARASEPLITPEEVAADLVLCTHFHEDHFDPEGAPAIARLHPEIPFAMPPTALSRARWLGFPASQVRALLEGESFTIGDMTVTATPARHGHQPAGWEVPDAIGLVIETGGVRFYHTGDTEYDLRLRAMKVAPPSVSTLCINGVNGNMNAHEAALLAWQIGSPVVIPHHYALFRDSGGNAEATLDPNLFAETYRKLGATGKVILPVIGERMLFGR